MCTVVIDYKPGAPWPLLLAANRDEMRGRAWRPPARHWDDHPHIVAGIDEAAGGTWMGLNDDGLVGCVLNRPGSLGPAEGKRSRGELPLEVLSHAEAGAAAQALAHLDGRAYRSFNLVIADATGAFWLRSTGETSAIGVHIVEPGVSLVTAHDLNDTSSPRIAAYLPRFRSAARPDPDQGDWLGWRSLLADRGGTDDSGEKVAMNVGQANGDGFGTVSSSLIALPGLERFGAKPVWLFCAGQPDRTEFLPVALGG